MAESMFDNARYWLVHYHGVMAKHYINMSYNFEAAGLPTPTDDQRIERAKVWFDHLMLQYFPLNHAHDKICKLHPKARKDNA